MNFLSKFGGSNDKLADNVDDEGSLDPSDKEAEQGLSEINDAIVYLLIDTSGSMNGVNLDAAKEGARKFALSVTEKGHYVGLISFDSYAEYISDPVNDIPTINRKISLLNTGGSTNMSDAFNMAYTCFEDIKPDLATVVVATDGMPDSKEDTIRAADKLKDVGVTIITIGTDGADENFLKKIASASDLVSVVDGENFEEAISKASDNIMLTDGS
ncbi:MAG: VWA domain-containing protein [Candidatus Pacebacteria bacterium]|nr:VWA domain-containing protein [Candidatus Paceibacterota bacterium]